MIIAHTQPEASSFPESPGLGNHIELVIRLRTLGFTGDIFYKEHPASFRYHDGFIGFSRTGLYRSESYVKQLRKLGCVLLNETIDHTISSTVQSSILVVTLTGTVALERSLCGLPTIVAGEPWFKGLPGTLSLSEMSDLDSISEMNLAPDDCISLSSENFLVDLLGKNMITNSSGIGNLHVLDDTSARGAYHDALKHIISDLGCDEITS
jgi:hypothetical protein